MSGHVLIRKTRRRTVCLHDTEPINVCCCSLLGSVLHIRVVYCQHQHSVFAVCAAAADVASVTRVTSQLLCDFVLVP